MILIFATALVLSMSVTAQQINPEKELVRKGYEYTSKAEFIKFAELIDPDELREMKNVFDAVVRSDSAGQFLNDFNPGIGAEEFYEMTPAQFFGRLLAFTFQRAPEAALELRNAEQQILGSVSEGDMLHVLVRNKLKGDTIYDRLEVVTVIQKNNKKYMKMKDEFKQLQQRAIELGRALNK